MTNINSTTNDSLSDVQNSVDITDDLASILEGAANKYTENLDALSKNAVLSRDSSVKTEYEQYKSIIHNYRESIKGLAESLKKYRAILGTCTELTDEFSTLTSVASFDAAAKDCKGAIASAKSATNSIFYDQFLREYTLLATELVSAYRDVIVTADKGAQTISLNDVVQTKQKIIALSQNKLSFVSMPDPSDALQKLTNVVNSQKSAFIR